MKIKEDPEDFIVKELSNIKLSKIYSNSYSIYILKKTNLTTNEAIAILAKKLKINKKEIGVSGFKDKYAVTYQYISIKGEKLIFNNANIQLEWQGYSKKPIEVGSHEGNHFEITLKLSKEEKLSKLETAMPNYFGEQRFGSIPYFQNSDDFIAKQLIKKYYWEAIKIFLTKYSEEDKDKEIKKEILENWKQLKKIKGLKGVYKKIVHTLVKTNNPLLALKSLSHYAQQSFIYAYQSYLWNEILRSYIESKGSISRAKYVCGQLSYPKKPLQNLKIPILNYKSDISTELKPHVDKILKKEGITQKQLRTKIFPEAFFSTSLRDAFVEVNDLKIQEKGNTTKLSFTLPKGSYATTLLKYLSI